MIFSANRRRIVSLEHDVLQLDRENKSLGRDAHVMRAEIKSLKEDMAALAKAAGFTKVISPAVSSKVSFKKTNTDSGCVDEGCPHYGTPHGHGLPT